MAPGKPWGGSSLNLTPNPCHRGFDVSSPFCCPQKGPLRPCSPFPATRLPASYEEGRGLPVIWLPSFSRMFCGRAWQGNQTTGEFPQQELDAPAGDGQSLGTQACQWPSGHPRSDARGKWGSPLQARPCSPGVATDALTHPWIRVMSNPWRLPRQPRTLHWAQGNGSGGNLQAQESCSGVRAELQKWLRILESKTTVGRRLGLGSG